MVEYTLHFDGSCWPNPGGTAAYGFLLKTLGGPVSGHEVIGSGPLMSNNLAEFYALTVGLNAFYERIPRDSASFTKLVVYGDSDLVVKMMTRVQRTGEIKGDPSKLYFPAYEGAIQSLYRIQSLGVTVDFKWIPREENQECDDLSKAHNATA
jgi:ribonuclease HI